MEEVQRSSEITMNAKTAAKEATEIGKAMIKMIRDMKLTSQQNQTSAIPTYANVLARGGLATTGIRATSPHSLKSYVDLALEQTSNEQIEKIKVVSSNRFKSDDLSVKMVTAVEMIELRQFAEDWKQRVENGALQYAFQLMVFWYTARALARWM
ncbi:uncharacterized protein FTOL_10483 [Fusarium torulosum]|uniref:Uncharacterized protein n=1 Tax=Fusarium torulosum TaxID=33205 RepID=A0AAE8MGG9_9HYPO|nr:uncharacterized protein FTOL_10483 [Fusarium torulosum]